MTDDQTTTYAAFLRGVNVGGHHRLTMDDLRDALAPLGWRDVRTYGQSGNVVFEALETDAAPLADDIEAAVLDAFGYEVPAMVRTRDDLQTVVDRQPFAPTDDGDTARYVTFLVEPPEPDAVRTLQAVSSDAEAFVVDGREVYSRLRKDLLDDGAFTDVGDVLGTTGTRRRWPVVRQVVTLAAE